MERFPKRIVQEKKSRRRSLGERSILPFPKERSIKPVADLLFCSSCHCARTEMIQKPRLDDSDFIFYIPCSTDEKMACVQVVSGVNFDYLETRNMLH
ncbi:hypothetical protein DTO021C3_2357 [Paecilomyces variotii]|nr:hypothetical protein DTO169C6_417 [Paecilomyces variotii]KAJ9289999.1 hypothetical protein DTO021C3_2357 [Paecilomyces variotii]